MAKQKTQQRPQQGARKEDKPKEPGTRAEAPPRMLSMYRDTVVPQLTKEFDYANVMRVPRIAKVVVNIGIGEEIDYDKIDKLRGLEVSIVTTARSDDEARSLLTRLGMPFRKR